MMIQPHYFEHKLIPFAKTIDNLSENTSLLSCFKKTFSQQIEELKTAKKNAPKHKKHNYSLPLYHTVLMKIIELIGENICFLKNLESKDSYKKMLLMQNTELNLYFDKYLLKYKKTPNTQTLRKLIENEIYFQIPFLSSSKLFSVQEIEQKKGLADCGYSMMEEINKWLDSSLPSDEKLFESVITRQVQDFLKWSVTHSKAASYLVSDMALTCSILLQKDISEKLITSLNARVFTRLFLDALGQCPEHEKVEEKEMLKYRALADLVSYCPAFATGYSLIKKTKRGEYTSFFNWAMDVIKQASINKTAKTISRIIPSGYERIVTMVIRVIQGKEFQEILLEQRNIELFKLAGTIKGIVTNPVLFFNGLEIWWKTVFESTGLEQKKRFFVQIVIPSTALYIFTAGVFAALKAQLLTGVVGLSAKTSVSLLLLAISWIFTSWIDATDGSKTKSEIIQKIKLREKNLEFLRLSHFLLTNEKKQEEIRMQVKAYILDLQNKHALPKIVVNNVKASPQDNEFIEKLKRKYLLKLKLKMDLQKKSFLASDILLIFYDVVNLKKMMSKLLTLNVANAEFIIFSVAENLINEWLQVHLEEIFREKLLLLYPLDKDLFFAENRHKEINVDDYLKMAITKKIKDESANQDLHSTNLLLKRLPVDEILQACF